MYSSQLLPQLFPSFVTTKRPLIGSSVLRPAEPNSVWSLLRWISTTSNWKYQRSSCIAAVGESSRAFTTASVNLAVNMDVNGQRWLVVVVVLTHTPGGHTPAWGTWGRWPLQRTGWWELQENRRSCEGAVISVESVSQPLCLSPDPQHTHPGTRAPPATEAIMWWISWFHVLTATLAALSWLTGGGEVHGKVWKHHSECRSQFAAPNPGVSELSILASVCVVTGSQVRLALALAAVTNTLLHYNGSVVVTVIIKQCYMARSSC